jgi:CRISPR system Cascade subunit CasC
MNKNFINFHVLISHSPSCLNRDDMNMQKTAIFGGKRRVRISSQSLKRTMRKSPYAEANLGEASIRTKRLIAEEGNDDLKTKIIEHIGNQFEPELITRTIELLVDKGVNAKGVIEGDAVAPWALEEVAWFCEQVQKAQSEGLDAKAISKKLKNDVAAMRRSLAGGIDIALFGRMATSGLMSELGKVDGALAVAHAITTHSVESDIDWFTAVDDLQEQGSGHLDTQEFSSGVFYRYASLNCAQLQENLGGCDREKVLEIASHVLHLLATETPSAKQQSFAAHNPADLALVSIADMPISLANAFEFPVQSDNRGGYRLGSIEALHNYWDSVHKGYGLEERCAEFCIEDVEIPESIRSKSALGDLKSWICNDGKDS